jgi:hypothetical protein
VSFTNGESGDHCNGAALYGCEQATFPSKPFVTPYRPRPHRKTRPRESAQPRQSAEQKTEGESQRLKELARLYRHRVEVASTGSAPVHRSCPVMPNVYCQIAAWKVTPRTPEHLRKWCEALGISISLQEAEDFVDAATKCTGKEAGDALRVTAEERAFLHFRTIRPGGMSDEQFRSYQLRNRADRMTARRRSEGVKPLSSIQAESERKRVERERRGISRTTQWRKNKKAVPAAANALNSLPAREHE